MHNLTNWQLFDILVMTKFLIAVYQLYWAMFVSRLLVFVIRSVAVVIVTLAVSVIIFLCSVCITRLQFGWWL